MPESDGQEKTEPATPKRREEARKKGQLAQSREIPSVLILLSSLGVFLFGGSWMFSRISVLMKGVFQNIGRINLQEQSFHSFLVDLFVQICIVLLPVVSVICIAGVAANLIQKGFLFTLKPLTPDLAKLNPISGMKRLVSVKSLVELVKSVLKIVMVGGIAFFMLRGELDNIPALIQMGIGEILAFFARGAFKICFYTCLALMILAVLDYVFQRWQHEKDMMMSKDEIKEELKQREGDPSIKARIRSIQREMARRRMMEMVPQADVVVTNPTTLAIALKYDVEKMLAPQVLAKGAGFVAERIKEIARSKEVPIVEHKPLAQMLFKGADIGDFIPANLYRAVAEVLAYVYRLKGKKKYYKTTS